MAKVNKGISMNNEVLDAQMHLADVRIEPTVSKIFTLDVFNKVVMNVMLIDNGMNFHAGLLESLNKEGIEARQVKSLYKAMPLIRNGQIECIIYRPDLKNENAYSFIDELASINYSGGVVVISENKLVKEQIKALNAGADAYLTVPFATEELIARIKSLSRFRKKVNSYIIEFNELKLDTPERRFYIHGTLVFVTKTEFEILQYFVENRNKVLTREELIFNSWKEKVNFEKYSVALYSHIKNIKKKIAENGGVDYIETLYGVGYKMTEK